MHHIFQFSDDEYTREFERGFKDGRVQGSFSTSRERTASFSFDIIGRQRNAGLSVQLLVPLREARYEGWTHRRGDPRDVPEMARHLLARWRQHQNLRFLVEQAGSHSLQDEEEAYWNSLQNRLKGDGFGPLHPVSRPEFRLTRDPLTDVALAETPLRFDAAPVLPVNCREVTLELSLGAETEELTFAV